LPRPERLLDAEQAVQTIAGLMPGNWVHRIQAAGRGLLLVDGVDELADRQRDKVRRWLGRMLGAFPDTRVVVTSRPLNTTARWLEREGFEPVTLDRMNPADVTAFVARWHDAAADGGSLPCRPDELPGYQAALLRHLDANPHLRTLAANPLLAALVCALNLDRRAQLPRDRMGLYAAALELLLERRDVEREVPADREFPLDLRQKTELLTGLAWWLTVNSHTEMSTDDAAREIGTRLRTLGEVGVTAEDALRYLVERSGVLREPVVGRIDFAHRTFQEYLAAREAAGHGMVGLLTSHAHLDTWHQTVVMAAGTDSTAFRADLLTALLDRAERGGRHARRLRLLAAACLETAPSLPETVRARVESALDILIPPRNHRGPHPGHRWRSRTPPAPRYPECPNRKGRRRHDPHRRPHPQPPHPRHPGPLLPRPPPPRAGRVGHRLAVLRPRRVRPPHPRRRPVERRNYIRGHATTTVSASPSTKPRRALVRKSR
ncbi:MAG TPA: NACHT domain-containing protein, partial [Mycobacteriales bacterium]|nr:NACHT domain-containing protein [Mycobacteriales bacterium]